MTGEGKQKIDFEDFLHDYFCRNNPEVLDDMLPDCTADWMTDMDHYEWIDLGNAYARKIAEGKDELVEALREAHKAITSGQNYHDGDRLPTQAVEAIEQALKKAGES